MSNIAIKFENISKQYRLGVVGTGTISHDLNRWWHLVRGKEDPYLKVGEVNDRSSKAISQYVWALKDINFEVEQGDVVGIIGRNGAGKSTLLKLLSRVTTPSTGIIKAKGRIASLLEVGTGFHPELTGRENIYMNGTIMGMTKHEITRKLDEIIDFAGVEKYIDTPAKRYSSGMTVRLGFAIAAHLEPEILVVDEVLAVGDAEFQKKAIGKMQNISKGEGRTVLFVSHNMGAVKSLCPKCLLMENGRVSLIGETNNVISRYIEMASSKNISDSKDEWITSIDERLKIKAPYFIGESNQIQKIFSQGESIKVVFEVDFIDEFKKIMIGIALDDIYGNRILTSHSIDDENFSISKSLKGKIRFICDLESKYLSAQSYNITFGIRNEANVSIIKSEVPLAFSIEPTRKIDGNAGILVNAGHWDMEL